MPDLETLIGRAARQGAHPDRLRASPPQLAQQMRASEAGNIKMSAGALVVALLGIGAVGTVAWLVVWVFYSALVQFARFPHTTFWLAYGIILVLLVLVAGLFRPRVLSEMSGLGACMALVGFGLFGAGAWLVLWAWHSGLSRDAPFPHGTFWITYGAIAATLTIGVSLLRPRSMYGTGRGPYTIGEDPFFWREGPTGRFQDFLRVVFAVPNLLRMSLYNLLSMGHLQRLKVNGDLALFVLLAADKRIVAEEILLAQRKKRPDDLYSVIAALARMEFLRCERLRRELVIWRGQAAEQMLGIVSEE